MANYTRFPTSGGGSGSGGITSINADTTAAQLIVSDTAGTDVAVATAAGTTTISIPTASASNRGALSTADWSTFNGKQASGSYITALTGDVTASGPGSSAASISNATVTGKLLTGYVSGAGTVASTDSILQAIQKLNGNAGNFLPLAGGTLTGTLTSRMIQPSADATYDLGVTSTNRWRSIFLSTNAVAGAGTNPPNGTGFKTGTGTAWTYMTSDADAEIGWKDNGAFFYFSKATGVDTIAFHTTQSGGYDMYVVTNNAGVTAMQVNGVCASKGVVDGSAASAGFLGEYIESVISTITAIPAATTAFGDLTSISLTAGDWDVTGTATYFLDGGGTSIITEMQLGISTTTGNSSTGLVSGSSLVYSVSIPVAAGNTSLVVPSYRISLAATTTVYLKEELTYSVATPRYRCRLSARRVR